MDAIKAWKYHEIHISLKISSIFMKYEFYMVILVIIYPCTFHVNKLMIFVMHENYMNHLIYKFNEI